MYYIITHVYRMILILIVVIWVLDFDFNVCYIIEKIHQIVTILNCE